MGRRPALIINEKKFSVLNLTKTLVNIPYGLEITWALLTPKTISPSNIVKRIAVVSIYSKPDSRKKTLKPIHNFSIISEKYPLSHDKLLRPDVLSYFQKFGTKMF